MLAQLAFKPPRIGREMIVACSAPPAPIERSNVYDAAEDFEAVLLSLFEKGMLTVNMADELVITPEGWRELDSMGGVHA
jgi:hypothetical protein